MDKGACGVGLDYRIAKERELSGKFPESFHSFWLLSENFGIFWKVSGNLQETFHFFANLVLTQT